MINLDVETRGLLQEITVSELHNICATLSEFESVKNLLIAVLWSLIHQRQFCCQNDFQY